MDPVLLLDAFTPTESWVERGCGYRQWRLLKGENVDRSEAAMHDGGFPSAQQVDLSSFVLEGLLGEGNYSQVFQGTLKATQQLVALKIIDKAKVKRYKKEDEVLVEKWLLSRLAHPSIIKLYHAFQDQSALYLSLEHVPSGELWSVTHKTGLPMSIARFYGAQMLEALQFLHEHDVVHRDVKPENVLIGEDGHIKLIDFGTAKLLRNPVKLGQHDEKEKEGRKADRRTKFKEFVGTPEYMAPETINNKFADQRADLWSLGCFLMQIIEGMPPFKGGSDYLTFKRVIARKYQHLEGAPPDAADLIDRLLALEPSDRLGGRWPDDVPHASKLGGEGVDRSAHLTRTYDHEAIRAHPFFAGHRGQKLWAAPVPMPTMQEMAMRELMMKTRAEGGAALGPPAAIANWPADFKTRVRARFLCRSARLLCSPPLACALPPLHARVWRTARARLACACVRVRQGSSPDGRPCDA